MRGFDSRYQLILVGIAQLVERRTVNSVNELRIHSQEKPTLKQGTIESSENVPLPYLSGNGRKNQEKCLDDKDID